MENLVANRCELGEPLGRGAWLWAAPAAGAVVVWLLVFIVFVLNRVAAFACFYACVPLQKRVAAGSSRLRTAAATYVNNNAPIQVHIDPSLRKEREANDAAWSIQPFATITESVLWGGGTGDAGELMLVTVQFCANPAHNLTRPPSYTRPTNSVFRRVQQLRSRLRRGRAVSNRHLLRLLHPLWAAGDPPSNLSRALHVRDPAVAAARQVPQLRVARAAALVTRDGPYLGTRQLCCTVYAVDRSSSVGHCLCRGAVPFPPSSVDDSLRYRRIRAVRSGADLRRRKRIHFGGPGTTARHGDRERDPRGPSQQRHSAVSVGQRARAQRRSRALASMWRRCSGDRLRRARGMLPRVLCHASVYKIDRTIYVA